MDDSGFFSLCLGCCAEGTVPDGAFLAPLAEIVHGVVGVAGAKKRKKRESILTLSSQRQIPTTIHDTRGASKQQDAPLDEEDDNDSDWVEVDENEDDDDDNDDDDLVHDDDDMRIADTNFGQGAAGAAATTAAWAALGFQSPQVAEKKRVLKVNEKVKTRNRIDGGTGSTKLKLITAAQRCRDFPNQSFFAVNNTIHCKACFGKVVQLKISCIENHIDSKRHVKGIEALKTKKEKGEQLQLYAVAARSEQAARGIAPAIPVEETATRIRVLLALLADGIPLNVLHRPPGSTDGIRALLEEGFGLLPYNAISELIPGQVNRIIAETEKLVATCGGCSVIFDGTPKVYEVFGVIVRFVCRGKVLHRLLALDLYKSSAKASGLAMMLYRALNGDQEGARKGVKHNSVRFFICDGASVNKKAVDSLRGEDVGLALYPEAQYVCCISHALNIVGSKVIEAAPLAAALLGAWVAVISHSFQARDLFKKSAYNTKAASAKTTSETRWYSKYEVIKQISETSGAVREVAVSEEEFARDSRATLLRLIEAPVERVAEMRLQLCAVTDIGRPLACLCYEAEGDAEFLCCLTYDAWVSCMRDLHALSLDSTPLETLHRLMPTVSELVQADVGLFVPTGDTIADSIIRDGLMRKAGQVAMLAYDKMALDSGISGRLASTLNLMRACRIFNYVLVASITIEAIVQESMQLLYLPAGGVTGVYELIREEAAEYKRLAMVAVARERANSAEHSISAFWNSVEQTPSVRTWYRLSREILLIVPSSAPVERVFSILTQGISSTQQTALHDYQLLSTMLKYNKGWPEPSM